MNYTKIIIMVLFLTLIAYASDPTATFVSPTPDSTPTLTNQTLQIAFNFTYTNISSCNVEINSTNYTGMVVGNKSCQYNYTMPTYTNVSVKGWITAVNTSNFYFYDDNPTSISVTNLNPTYYLINASNYYDHDWDTYTATYTVPDPPEYSGYARNPGDIEILIHYSWPNTVGNKSLMKWQAKKGVFNSPQTKNWTFDNDQIYNHTGCFLQSDLYINVTPAREQHPDCWNGTVWVQMMGENYYNAPYYEQAMWWYINTSSTETPYSTNETRTYCYPSCTNSTPTIVLNSPPNNNISNSSSMEFNFTETDENYPNVSCSIYLDNILNQTNDTTLNNTPTTFDINVPDGSHNWLVNCSNGANNSNVSETWNFTVDTDIPLILNLSPMSGYGTTGQVITFSFNATDNTSPILNCSLFVNDTLNQTNTSALNNTNTSFVQYFITGDYNWSIMCKDMANNTNITDSRPLFILVPSGGGGTGGTGGGGGGGSGTVTIPCVSDISCPAGYKCIGGKCIVTIPTPPQPPPVTCILNSGCPSGYVCTNGVCVNSSNPNGCISDANCPQGYGCVNGVCAYIIVIPPCDPNICGNTTNLNYTSPISDLGDSTHGVLVPKETEFELINVPEWMVPFAKFLATLKSLFSVFLFDAVPFSLLILLIEAYILWRYYNQVKESKSSSFILSKAAFFAVVSLVTITTVILAEKYILAWATDITRRFLGGG